MAEAVPREVDVPVKEDPKASWKYDVKWAVSLLLVAILGLSGWNNSLWQEEPAGREDLARIAEFLLSAEALVFLLQLVGVLLVAALLGAVVIAIRDPEPGEDYPEAPEEYSSQGYVWGREGR